MFEFIDDLLKMEADLVVTVTSTIDPTQPNKDDGRIRLRNLLSEARSAVSERLDSKEARPVLENIDAAAEAVELRGGFYGVVIVATADHHEAHLVPFPIREGVELATTPATRYLIQGMRRSPRSRVLVISDHGARLLEGVRYDMIEVNELGFPFTSSITRRDNRAIAGRFAQDPGGDRKEVYRKFYRVVDAALTEAGSEDPLPLILAGVRSSTELFEDVSANTSSIVGYLEGSHDRSSSSELGEEAWKIVKERLRERRDSVIAELNDKLHTGKAVAGMDEVWQFAREGRGALLVVEETYKHTPSVERDLRLIRAEDAGLSPENLEVMEDPVDELIEHVVRARGDVEFVAEDALSEMGRVGLILR